MKEDVAIVFAENIKRFLDNTIGLYNIFVVSDLIASKLYCEMIEIAMNNAGLSKDDYNKVIASTKKYTDAGINNKEYPDLIGEIKEIVIK